MEEAQEAPLPAVPERGGTDVRRRRPSPLESWRDFPITTEERAARRRNRKWLVGVFVPSVAVLVAALIASGVAESNQPSGPRISVPAGYRAVGDGYYAYAVPSSWSQNGVGTDSAGDVEWSGPGGFAGEHIGYRKSGPTLGDPPPAALNAFGAPDPDPVALSSGRPMTVPGADVAFSYTATRAGGFRGTAVHAWSSRSGVELWLLVGAGPAQVSEVLSSLRG